MNYYYIILNYASVVKKLKDVLAETYAIEVACWFNFLDYSNCCFVNLNKKYKEWENNHNQRCNTKKSIAQGANLCWLQKKMESPSEYENFMETFIMELKTNSWKS